MTAAREQILGATVARLAATGCPPRRPRRSTGACSNRAPMWCRSAAVLRLRNVALFIAEAERVNATTARLSSLGEVPAAVIAYLRAGNLPPSAPEPTR